MQQAQITVLGIFGLVTGWVFVPRIAGVLLCRFSDHVSLRQAQRQDFPAKYSERILCGVAGMSAMVVIGALLGFSFAKATGALLCFFAMLIAVVCDIRARILPLECCVVLAVSAVVFQMEAGGIAGVGVGLIWALVVVSVCLALNHFTQDSQAIGYGDIRCMAALSIASGYNSGVGFSVCYIVAALCALVGLISKKLTLHTALPMAPFLLLWLVCGILMEASQTF